MLFVVNNAWKGSRALLLLSVGRFCSLFTILVILLDSKTAVILSYAHVIYCTLQLCRLPSCNENSCFWLSSFSVYSYLTYSLLPLCRRLKDTQHKFLIGDPLETSSGMPIADKKAYMVAASASSSLSSPLVKPHQAQAASSWTLQRWALSHLQSEGILRGTLLSHVLGVWSVSLLKREAGEFQGSTLQPSFCESILDSLAKSMAKRLRGRALQVVCCTYRSIGLF